MAGQSALTPLTMGKALTAGLRSAMARDDRVLIMGEDIGRLGGVFRITDGLQAEFGAQRVLDTPLAESGIVGTAVGLAYRGFRPVVGASVLASALEGPATVRLAWIEAAGPGSGTTVRAATLSCNSRRAFSCRRRARCS